MGEVTKMTTVCSMGLVLVEFGYEYLNEEDGSTVSIKPNERYTLLSKTNDHWWHVCKDESTKPFYIPAKYVKELPSTFPSPLDFADPPVPETRPSTVPDLAEKAKPNEVTIRVRSPKNPRKTENRMSTFGVPLDIQDPPPYKYGGLTDSLLSLSSNSDAAQQKTKLTPSLILSTSETKQKPRARNISPADVLSRQAKPVEPPVIKNPIETILQGLPPRTESLTEPNTESSPEPTARSENIYESISDLHLEHLINTGPSPPVPHEATASRTSSVSQEKPEPENPTTAVYANVIDLKKLTPRLTFATTSTCSSPDLNLSPAPDSPEWEPRTEQDSGRQPPPTTGMDASALSFPAMPSPSVPAPSSLPPTVSLGSDWQLHLDEATGRHFYYSASLNRSSWTEPVSPNTEDKETEVPPPLPEEDYPSDEHDVPVSPHAFRDTNLSHIKPFVLPRVTLDPGTSIPPGWTCSTETGGQTVFTNDHTQQQWVQLKDEKGKLYYYSKDGSKSQWSLPETLAVAGQPVVGNGVETEVGIRQDSMQKFFPTHRRIASDYSSDTSSTGNLSDVASTHLEKAGILNKTKISDNGKKLRKNWAQSWSVLHGGILTFYKDPKSYPGGNVTKTNQIVAEFTVELKGANVCWATKEKSSKKNVLELKTRHGSEYLIQYDTDAIIYDWHKIIQDTIKHLDHDHCSEEEEDEVIEKSPQPVERERKSTAIRQSSTGSADIEQGRVRNKLRKFLQRRPTLQSVKEKGYIKDNVFGCHLDTLCHRENADVPRFLEKCIRSVERRGLNVDGIYRVSGNLAVIQKLRYKADHEENLDLDDGQWEEIHVITGALKLFLRELPEPLFTYSSFEKFIAAIQIPDQSQRVLYMRDLVRNLPMPNYNTMDVLFKHLRKVVEHTDSNRMTYQSMGIVFGPTLLRPERETGNMPVHMVCQNQIVELILSRFNEVFCPR
ncbi:rho GTPase-activating protein 27 isoform X2 [Trichomycterus rosablanca]|uniref:rho GTPase-activating protein 27 isoform X2 n=1 Tax=Trichomycterus rosablanca TaxID=2290929 RepID=UPI002F352BDD